MAFLFSFDIYPSDTIIFSAQLPDPVSGAPGLTITTPDQVVITMTGNTVPLEILTDFDPTSPGTKINITVEDINGMPSGVITQSGNPLTSLPWSKFPPGVYTVNYTVDVQPGLTEEFLLFTTIDDCLYAKIDGLMYDACCDKCNGSETKQLVEKLLAVKEGAKLDFKYTAYADLTAKLTALEHVCEGSFCECKCNC